MATGSRARRAGADARLRRPASRRRSPRPRPLLRGLESAPRHAPSRWMCAASARRPGRAAGTTPLSPTMNPGTTDNNARSDFLRERRRQALSSIAARLRAEPDDVSVMLPFDEVVHALGRRGESDLGLQAVAELVEEHLGRGHRAEQVDLDHAPLFLALLGGKRRQQHHAGVVDQDVGSAELVLDALGGGYERVAVGDVSLDGDRTVAELVGERMDAVGAAGQQRDAVAVGGERAGGGCADARRGAGDDRDAAVRGFDAHGSTVAVDATGWGALSEGHRQGPKRAHERATVRSTRPEKTETVNAANDIAEFLVTRRAS